MIVEGIRIDREDEVLSFVRKQLTEGTVWLHKHDQGNLDGLTRAVRESGDLRPAFARAILKLLSDDDRTIRSGAVAFLSEVAEDIGAPALVDCLKTHQELFYRVKPSRKYPLHYDDLAGALLVSIGRTTQPDDARSIEVLREALKENHAWEVASSLARVDADWLCDHATLVPRDVLGAMLLSLPTPAHRERLVRALAPWPESERELVLDKRFWKMLDADPAEVDKLKQIIAPGPASPTERFLCEPGDPGSIRVELWEADFMRRETFNAVIFGTGRVEVQSIEYQVEHRFRFGIPAAELEGLIAAIAAADPLSCPPHHDRSDEETGEYRHPPPTRIVLVNASGERKEFSFLDDPPEAFERCRRVIVEVADPFRRGIEPLWSRGPYTGIHPFPES